MAVVWADGGPDSNDLKINHRVIIDNKPDWTALVVSEPFTHPNTGHTVCYITLTDGLGKCVIEASRLTPA